MSALLQRLFQPGTIAALAALLVAVGIETDAAYIHHTLEVVGAIVAGIGFLIGLVWGGRTE